MKSKVLGLALALSSGAVIWLGCGGSSEEASSGKADSGPGPTVDSGGGVDANKPIDSGKDTSVQDTGKDGSIDAPQVNIQYGNCPAWVPCGGEPAGIWKVSGGCVRETFFDQAKQQCPTLQESNVVFKAKGIATISATNAAIQTEVFFSAKFFIPKPCIDALPIAVTCAQIGPLLSAQLGLDKATCADAPAATPGCNCDIEETATQNTANAYTKAGTTLTAANGDTYEYCVQGNKLSYEQTGVQGVPAVFELTK